MSKLTQYLHRLVRHTRASAKSEFRFWFAEFRHALFGFRGVFQKTVTVRTKREVFTVPTRDLIGGDIYINRQYYEHEFCLKTVEFLKTHGFIPRTNVSLLDIGANIGPICIGLAQAGQIDRAVAIEPEPQNFELLVKNVRQNNLAGRIVCLQLAVGETPSTLTMELSSNNRGDHRIRSQSPRTASEIYGESARPKIEVPSLPLARLLALPDVQNVGLTKPCLVWIDVQGYEGYVFKGAIDLLKDGYPTVAEIWPYGILRAGMSLEELCQIVAAIWTDYWILRESRYIRYPISMFDRYIDELSSDGPYGNVIFTRGQPASQAPAVV